jgi:4'-phosphopantetheinyl transferase
VALETDAEGSPPASRWITDQEHVDSQAYFFRRDRHRSMRSRAVLRQLLGSYLGLDPSHVALTRGVHGKPMVMAEGRGQPLFFNLAHSQGLMLVAIAPDHPVGIDLEAVKPDRDLSAIARRFFTSRECAHWMAVSAPERSRAFMVLWTRKEAALKAAGLGLAGGLEQLEVSADFRRPASLIRAPLEMLPVTRWKLLDLVPADGYHGCLCIESQKVVVKQWVWSDASDAHPQAGPSDGRGIQAIGPAG